MNGSDRVLMGHKVQAGDIYRSCQTKDAPIEDWVKLAVKRCRANDFPNNSTPCKAVFWLDSARPHDVILMDKVQQYLPLFDTKGLDTDKVDINNANIQAYRQFPGMYPTAAGAICTNGPYKQISDIYNIPNLPDNIKAIIKKYEANLVALPPNPAYYLDRINNFMYR